MPPHPFRFGVINEHAHAAPAWVDQARRAEELGYATFLIRDHFTPDFFGAQLAPFTALMAAAAATRTLRVGTLVIDNDYRHPVVLAKEVATLDLLSGGRLELGIGAGWLRSEYEHAGLPFESPGTRIDRLQESLAVLKGLFADAPLTFGGKHYAIDALDGFPKPAQRPHPPILIGAGSPRMLRLAGREANIVGVLGSSTRTGTLLDDPLERLAESVERKIACVREGSGTRFADVELSTIVSIVVTDARRERADTLIRERGWTGLTAEQVLDMPSLALGTVEQIAETLAARRERLGFSYYVVSDASMEAFAPVVTRLRGR
jgi:probable F420-dependent oxidoreductase